MPEVTGRLEGWYWDESYSIIWGYLYDDVRNRWRDGQHIHTSYIKDKKKYVEGDLVSTLNSTYLLGKPL